MQRNKKLLYTFPFILFFLPLISFSQNEEWKAFRCGGVDRSNPINNIAVGGDNNKYVANTKRLYQVRACDLVSGMNSEAGMTNVLTFRGGNADFSWSKESLETAIGGTIDILTAWYDSGSGELLIGTESDGLFFFTASGNALQLDKQMTSGNSKLKSSHINIILKDRSGKYWIGTEEGLLVGKDGKWKLELSGYGVQRVRERGSNIYVLADGELWTVENGSKFRAVVTDEEVQEGEVYDFDVDDNEKFWILSAIVAEYDWYEDEYKLYSGPEDYTSEYGNCIAVDRDGDVWIGTQDKGLYRIGPDNDMAVLCEVSQNLSCKGDGKDGALSVKVSGGVGPFTYSWSDASVSGESPTGLAAGKYTVTVSDSQGHEKEAEITLDDPRMTLTTKVLKPESAKGAGDGSAEVNVKGGNPRYTYKWDSGEGKSTAYKLSEGEHAVTVTDSEGCTATATVNVTQIIAELDVTLTEATPIKCAGNNNAELTAVVQGGKEPYSFAWSDPAFSNDKASKVAPGKYTVTVTDALGKTAVSQVVVAQPAPLSAVALVRASADVDQANGQASVQVQGGTGSYSYSWDNGESTQLAEKLAAGTHMVTVTDENGCTKTGTVEITEDILPLQVSVAEIQAIKCATVDQAQIQANRQGGKGPFNYNWSDASLSGEGPHWVAPGSYSVTITDSQNSTQTARITVTGPDALTLSINKISDANTDSEDGIASAKISGGTTPYSLKWDNGETENKAVALAPGTRQLIVTDANGCTSKATVEIEETILPLSINLEATADVKCFGGNDAAIESLVRGGKKPYSYQWKENGATGNSLSSLTAGTYTLVVTDGIGTTQEASITVEEPKELKANAIQVSPATTNKSDGVGDIKAQGGTSPYAYTWDNGEKGSKALELAPGTHQYTVTDGNGCSLTGTVDITEDIQPLVARLKEEEVIKCAEDPKGILAVEVEGGKPPYEYKWNKPGLQGPRLTDLNPGNYALTLSDAAGNTKSFKIDLKSPDTLLVNMLRKVGASEEWTNDGKATLEVKGGTKPYKIEWNTGETGLTARQLDIGTNTVSVSDAYGCSRSIEFVTEKRILPELTPGMLRSGQKIRMERLQFEADSSRLTPECLPVLEEVFFFLEDNPAIVIEVGGHTNSTPPDEFCDRLSTARAKSVAAYLAEKGIDPKRVVYKGYGKRKPIASNATREGRKRNQRVEIKILRVE